ncbi:hypothetical protein NDU88_005114 [Pleurodeles waltl]|uniref:Uncharacterized protein n=1 Tax=Pleurodeles waltl TaxID=8319 RepID=A0AAV7LWI7_PLEWA|nr:hypothetical protein NDU88_005114 [Pleurodeles waltl]
MKINEAAVGPEEKEQTAQIAEPAPEIVKIKKPTVSFHEGVDILPYEPDDDDEDDDDDDYNDDDEDEDKDEDDVKYEEDIKDEDEPAVVVRKVVKKEEPVPQKPKNQKKEEPPVVPMRRRKITRIALPPVKEAKPDDIKTTCFKLCSLIYRRFHRAFRRPFGRESDSHATLVEPLRWGSSPRIVQRKGRL